MEVMERKLLASLVVACMSVYKPPASTCQEPKKQAQHNQEPTFLYMAPTLCSVISVQATCINI